MTEIDIAPLSTSVDEGSTRIEPVVEDMQAADEQDQALQTKAKSQMQGRLKSNAGRNRNQNKRAPMGSYATVGPDGGYYWPSVLASCLSPWTARAVSSCYCDKCERVFVNDCNVLQHFRESWYHTETAEHYEASHVLYLYECQELQMASYANSYNMPTVTTADYGTEAYSANTSTIKSGRMAGGKVRKAGTTISSAPGAPSAASGDMGNGVAAPHSDLYTPSDSSEGCDDMHADGLSAAAQTGRGKKDITGLLPATSAARKPVAAAGGVESVMPVTPIRRGRKQPGQPGQPAAAAPAVAPKTKEDYNSAFPPLAVGDDGGPVVSPPSTPTMRWAPSASTRKLRVEAPTWTPKNLSDGVSETQCSSASSADVHASEVPAEKSVDSSNEQPTSDAAADQETVSTASPALPEPSLAVQQPVAPPHAVDDVALTAQPTSAAPVVAATVAAVASGKPPAFAAIVAQKAAEKAKAAAHTAPEAQVAAAPAAAQPRAIKSQDAQASVSGSDVAPEVAVLAEESAAPTSDSGTQAPPEAPTEAKAAPTPVAPSVGIWASRSFAATAALAPPPKPPPSVPDSTATSALTAASKPSRQTIQAPRQPQNQQQPQQGLKRRSNTHRDVDSSAATKPSPENRRKPRSDQPRNGKASGHKESEGEGGAQRAPRNRDRAPRGDVRASARSGTEAPASLPPHAPSQPVAAPVEVARSETTPAPRNGVVSWASRVLAAPAAASAATQPKPVEAKW